MNAMLKWWIQFSLTAFAAGLMYHYDWWKMIYDADLTKISFLIIFIFVLSTLSVGWLSSRSTWELTNDKIVDYVSFAAEAMTRFGMIGTVAGFLLMLGTAFETLDVSNVKNVQDSIQAMAVGMSTALVTTLVGLVCSTLTQIQLVVYENSEQNE